MMTLAGGDGCAAGEQQEWVKNIYGYLPDGERDRNIPDAVQLLVDRATTGLRIRDGME
jgi:hypothetical protein